MAELPSPGESPSWIRDAVANGLGELRLFFATAKAFTFHPVRFAGAFIEGRQRAMNPLAFLATSAGLLGGLRLLLRAATASPDANLSLPGQLFEAVAPYLHYAALGCIAHLVFRATGSGRPLRDSLAMALFAGGGPAAFADLFTLLTGAAFDLAHPALAGQPQVAPQGLWLFALIAMPTITFSVFSASLASSLASAHGARQWWRSAIAILGSYTATGLLFGVLDLKARYGMHWVITFARTASGWPAPRIGLGM